MQDPKESPDVVIADTAEKDGAADPLSPEERGAEQAAHDKQPAKDAQPPPEMPRVDMTDEMAEQLILPIALGLSRLKLYEGMTTPMGASFRQVGGVTAIQLAKELINFMRGGEPKDRDVISRMIRELLLSMPVAERELEGIMRLTAGQQMQTKIGITDGKSPKPLADVVVTVRQHSGLILAGGMPANG